MVLDLRRAIEESGQSLTQLGKASGVSAAQLSRFVRGERDITLSVAGRIADTLGLMLTPAKPTRKKGKE